MFPEYRLGLSSIEVCVNSTYIFGITAAIFGSEANEVEAIVTPVVAISKLGPVEPNLLGRGALVISLLWAGVADVGAPPLQYG